MSYYEILPDMLDVKLTLPICTATEYENGYEYFRTNYAVNIAEFVNEYNNLSSKEEKENLVSKLSETFIVKEKDKVSKVGFFKKGVVANEDNILLATFIIPLFDSMQCEACDKLCDSLVDAWKTAFPKFQIKRGNYEDIASAFADGNWFRKTFAPTLNKKKK